MDFINAFLDIFGQWAQFLLGFEIIDGVSIGYIFIGGTVMYFIVKYTYGGSR